MVIALASYQHGTGSNPRPGVISELGLLLVLVLAPRVFLLPQKSTFLNSNSIGNSRGVVTLMSGMCYPC